MQSSYHPRVTFLLLILANSVVKKGSLTPEVLPSAGVKPPYSLPQTLVINEYYAVL